MEDELMMRTGSEKEMGDIFPELYHSLQHDDKTPYKVICIDITNPFGVRLFEDENCGSFMEVHEFVNSKVNDYPNGYWLMMPLETSHGLYN